MILWKKNIYVSLKIMSILLNSLDHISVGKNVAENRRENLREQEEEVLRQWQLTTSIISDSTIN